MENQRLNKVASVGYEISKFVAAIIVIGCAIVGVMRMTETKSETWIFLVLVACIVYIVVYRVAYSEKFKS